MQTQNQCRHQVLVFFLVVLLVLLPAGYAVSETDGQEILVTPTVDILPETGPGFVDFQPETKPVGVPGSPGESPTEGNERTSRNEYAAPRPSAVTVSRDLLIFPATASPPAFLEADPVGTTMRILVSLAVVIVLVFLVSWFLQKRGGFMGPGLGRIHGLVPLDNKRILYVVEVLGKVMILGVTEHNINHLADISDPEALARLRLEQPDTQGSHLESMFGFLRKRSPRQQEGGNQVPAPDVQHQTERTKQKLARMTELLLQRRRENPPED